MAKIKFFVLALVAVGFLSASCERMQTNSYEETGNKLNPQKEDAVKEPSPLSITTPGTPATIKFLSSGGPVVFKVEIAKTDQERKDGLQNRESLPENNGMWFEFDTPDKYEFWMKDTKFPLDLVYVDDNMKVSHIIENTVPLSETKLQTPVSFRYVLEINGGLVAKKGIKVGDTVVRGIESQ